MKNLLLLTLLLTFSISLSSCQKEDNETETYVKEYMHYKPIVSHYMGTIEKKMSDTLKREVDLMVSNLSYRSCIYCTGGLIHEVSPEAKRKSLLFIADNLFKGKDSRLKYVFQYLFKTFYPKQYDLLLEEFDMQKAVEWSDIEKEFNNLPMQNMFDKYLEIEFEKE